MINRGILENILQRLETLNETLPEESSRTRKLIKAIDTHLMRKYLPGGEPSGILVDMLAELRSLNAALAADAAARDLARDYPARDRMNADTTITIVSADDGYRLEIEGTKINEELEAGGHTYSPPHIFNPYKHALSTYLEARNKGDKDLAKTWEGIVRQILNGDAVIIAVTCWNHEGASSISYELSAANKLRVDATGSSAPGRFSCEHKYQLCYDWLTKTDYFTTENGTCEGTATEWNRVPGALRIK